MPQPRIYYSDEWGECLIRPDDHCTEIRWFDTTAAMSSDDFNAFLAQFATTVERSGQSGALVDAVQFKMPMSKMEMGWRNANIIPRYNAANLTKFAFIMPAGMPLIGAPPQSDGPATFPTAYFATRAEALDWLKA